jgi:hypothetical protein
MTLAMLSEDDDSEEHVTSTFPRSGVISQAPAILVPNQHTHLLTVHSCLSHLPNQNMLNQTSQDLSRRTRVKTRILVPAFRSIPEREFAC